MAGVVLYYYDNNHLASFVLLSVGQLYSCCLVLGDYVTSDYCVISGHRVTLPPLKLMVRILDNSLLDLLKTLGLKIFVLQQWCLQPLLHAHALFFCRLGYFPPSFSWCDTIVVLLAKTVYFQLTLLSFCIYCVYIC